jgi:hypothetical protein
MKTLLSFLALVTVFTLHAQDISKMLQNRKWYARSTKGKIVYSHKNTGKDLSTYTFRENGKVIHCGLTTESSLDANGKEITTGPAMRCDSVRHYEVKNGMLMIQLLKQTPDYYKLAMKADIIELIPIKPEDFK